MANTELQKQYLKKIINRQSKDAWLEFDYYGHTEDGGKNRIDTLLVRKSEVMLVKLGDTGRCVIHFLHHSDGACYPIDDYETLKKQLLE